MKNLPVSLRDKNIIPYQDVYYQVIPESDKEGFTDFHKYLNILRRKKWITIIPVFFIFPLTTMYLYIQKPQYHAQVTLLIEDLSPRVLTNIQDVIAVDRTQDFFNTQYEIIKSRAIAEEVVDTLQLHKIPKKEDNEIEKKIKYILETPSRLLQGLKRVLTRFADYLAGVPQLQIATTETGGSGTGSLEPLEEYRQAVISRFQSSLIVRPRENTKLVDIGVRGENPQDAAKQANMAAQVYIRQNLEKKLDVARKAVVWLTKEEATLRERVHNAELALQDFRERNKLVSLDHDERQNLVLQNLSTLNSTYMEARRSRIDLQSRIGNLRKLLQKDIDDLESYPDILSNSSISRLRDMYFDLRYEYNILIKNYTEKHPKLILINSQMQEVKNKINEEIKSVINSMQITLNSLMEKENSINSILGEQKRQVLELKNDLITFNSLKNELEINKDLYLAVSKRLREAKLTEALETNNVKIVQHALAPSWPAPARNTLKLLLGIFAGLGLGAGIAFVSDYLDRRFKSATDIERELGIPLLGVIPRYKTSKRKLGQLITLADPWSSASEAYRSIRTWIQLSAPKALQTLLITSAVPHEGKSTTSANLAVAYAQLGRKVLLIDVDLRRPTIHRIFNMGNNSGLTDVLTGKAHWEHIIQNTPIENLKALFAGPIPPNPVELLSTGRFNDLLHSLKNVFDTIICDSPVQLSIPDVAIIAPDMDGVLIVHCPSRVNKEEVLETRKLLERANANIIGIVLNNIYKKDQQYYYSYYNEYSYSSFPSSSQGNHDGQFASLGVSQTLPSQEYITKKANESPLLEISPTIKIVKSTRSHNISIVFHGISFLSDIDKHISDKEMLLAAFFEITNYYESDYLFSPNLSKLHIVDGTYYEMIHSYFSEMNIDNHNHTMLYEHCHNTYTPDSSTARFERGFYTERYIKPKMSEQGLIIYRIPKESEYYLLTYVNGETRITIPFNKFLEANSE
jgi:capsular exopolysaccharide synthesis family protein